MTVKNIGIQPTEIKNEAKKTTAKAQGAPVDSNFDSFLGAMNAMTPTATMTMEGATGSTPAAAILNGAFTGVSGAAGAYGYGQAGGAGGGYGGFGSLSEYPGMMGVGSYGTSVGYAGGYKATTSGDSVIPGTGGAGGPALYTSDLINSMNTNNLKLLELQAVMQSNMQAWNTKANILSADHRARMAMIEKFAVRG